MKKKKKEEEEETMNLIFRKCGPTHEMMLHVWWEWVVHMAFALNFWNPKQIDELYFIKKFKMFQNLPSVSNSSKEPP
jgi:hypothetical protein